MKKGILVFVLFSLLLSGRAVRADDALLCLQETARQEKIGHIQTNLLSAIALAESGRFSKKYASGVAWPWTVTTAERGVFFNTKEEALAEVRRLREEGSESIDVGCMQINLKYHPEAFDSLEDAFDPAKNVAYAAEFLKRNYRETRSWGEAATRYHSKTTHKAFRYEDKLLEIWKRLAAHGNPAKPGEKAAYRDVSKEAVNRINNKILRPKKAPEKPVAKRIKPGSPESREIANQWRKAKLEEYMARRKAERSVQNDDEPVFEDATKIKNKE